MTQKVLENRLRRIADRMGLRLQKSRARDPRDVTYDGWQLVDIETGGITLGHTALGRGYGAALEDIAAYLADDAAEQADGN